MMMKNILRSRRLGLATTMLVTGTLAGCAGQPGVNLGFVAAKDIFNNPNVCSNRSRNLGLFVGAIGGAMIGNMIHNNATATLLGAAAGATAGGLIGHAVDVRRCNLYRIAEENHIRMASAVITSENLGLPAMPGSSKKVGLEAQIPEDSTMFVPGTAELTPQAQSYLGQIAQQYRASGPNGPQEKILIVGHSAESEGITGEEAARLTQQRALAVSQVFAENGIPESDIYYQGAGDALPIATPGTAYGQRDNSRIQIVGVPSDDDLGRYLNRRTTLPPPPPAQPAATTPETSSSAPGVATGLVPPPVPSTVPQPPAYMAALDTFGFDGSPTADGTTIDLGPTEGHNILPFITTASAASYVQVPACILSRVQPTTPVINLATGREFDINDSLPGLYGAPWVGDVGNSLVALLHVRAPADTGSPVPQPIVQIYKDRAQAGHRQPSFSARRQASVYRGKNGILYRVFVNGPVQCIDMVKPPRSEEATAHVYYSLGGHHYEATSSFELRK